MVGLIGANGSGKTTLARLMAGLQAPSSGRVLLRGSEPHRVPAAARARRIGFIFQNPDHQIFCTTVREEAAFGPVNLGLDRAEVDRRVGAALEAVGLEGSASADPFAMTKGERQRVALASVLACEPETIVMDEPTTGLDLAEQARVMSVLEGLNRRGHTIIVMTHALWLLHGPVRRVLLLVEGRLAADGPPEEILTDEPLMGSAGLRPPDLARLARLQRAPLLTVEAWAAALVPPGRP
jgi:energy-coupling factor transport system ATP-binding protein